MSEAATKDYKAFFAGKKVEQEAKKAQRDQDRGKKSREVFLTRKNNLGTLMGKIISDSNGVPIHSLEECWSVWLPIRDDEGVMDEENKRPFVLPSIDQYAQPVTQGQRDLYDSMVEHLEAINEIEGYEIRSYKELHIFFMKVIGLSGSDGKTIMDQNSGVIPFVHTSAAFYPAIQTAIEQNNALFGNDQWISKFFDRTLGNTNNVAVISTTNKSEGFGYNVSVMLQAGRSIEVTQEDLDRAHDLRSEYVNLLSFPEDKYREAIEVCKELIKNNEEGVKEETGATEDHSGDSSDPKPAADQKTSSPQKIVAQGTEAVPNGYKESFEPNPEVPGQFRRVFLLEKTPNL